MSTTTTNYGLTKPEKSDNYSVDVMGNNMDIIDIKLKEFDDELNGDLVCDSVTVDTVTANNYVGLPTRYNYVVKPSSNSVTIVESYGTHYNTILQVPIGSTISGTVSSSSGTLCFYLNSGSITTATSATDVSIPSDTYKIAIKFSGAYTNATTAATFYLPIFVSVSAID